MQQLTWQIKVHFYLKRKCCTFICYSQLWRLGLISSRFSLIKLPFVKLASSEDYLFFIRDNPPEPDATKNLISELFCLVVLVYWTFGLWITGPNIWTTIVDCRPPGWTRCFFRSGYSFGTVCLILILWRNDPSMSIKFQF